MNAAATSTVTTFAGCLTQLNSLTNGVNMVPSSLNEEAIYVEGPEAQMDLPQLMEMDGKRADVIDVVKSALPVDMVGEEKEMRAKSADFVARIDYLDALMDRKLASVMKGLRNRGMDTFKGKDEAEQWENFREFWKVIECYDDPLNRVEKSVREIMRLGDIPGYLGGELMTTAAMNAEIDEGVAAHSYFIAGRLLATQVNNDDDSKIVESEKALDLAMEAFMKAASIFVEAERFISAGIAQENAAQIEELRGKGSQALRAAAADSWLASSRWALEKENKADRASANIRIFRGLWNASMAGADETMIALLELSATQLIRAGRYESAANDYIRILKLKLGIESEEDAYEWDEIASDMATVMDYSRRAGKPTEYLDSLIELHGIATKNADETRVDA